MFEITLILAAISVPSFLLGVAVEHARNKARVKDRLLKELEKHGILYVPQPSPTKAPTPPGDE